MFMPATGGLFSSTFKSCTTLGFGDGSDAQSTDCHCRGPGFSSHMVDHKTSVAQISWYPVFYSPLQNIAYNMHRHTRRQTTHIH